MPYRRDGTDGQTMAIECPAVHATDELITEKITYVLPKRKLQKVELKKLKILRVSLKKRKLENQV